MLRALAGILPLRGGETHFIGGHAVFTAGDAPLAEHRASGGMILAATHAPLGLIDARELRLDAPPRGSRLISSPAKRASPAPSAAAAARS